MSNHLTLVSECFNHMQADKWDHCSNSAALSRSFKKYIITKLYAKLDIDLQIETHIII